MTANVETVRIGNVRRINDSLLLFMSRELRDLGLEEGDEVKITRTEDCEKIIIESISDDTRNEPAQPDSGD